MAADDAERRGRRRWFRILGAPDADDAPRATIVAEEPRAAYDLIGDAPKPSAPDAGDAETAVDTGGGGPALVVTEAPARAGRRRGIRGTAMPTPRSPRPSGRRRRRGGGARGGSRSGARAGPEPGARRSVPASELMDAPEPDRRCRGSSRSPTRRAASARPRPRSTSARRSPSSASGCSSSTSTRRATRRPGSGSTPATSRASIYDVIMNDTPIEDCVEPTSRQEPLRGPGDHRPRRRRDRAGPRVQPRAQAAPGARQRSATTTTSCSSTARRRSACSPSTGSPPPTT